MTDDHDDRCRVHVQRYLLAPFLADHARSEHATRGEHATPSEHAAQNGHATHHELALHFDPATHHDLTFYTDEVVTPGVPASLRRALEEWVVDESTPDEDIAQFIGWPVARVREHR